MNMRNFKNIIFSLLMAFVLIVGVSASLLALENGEYVYFDRGDIYRVADSEFEIPYLYATATYKGYGLYHQFRAVVGVNFNNQGLVYGYGSPSWSSSTASLIIEPCMPTDTYTWIHTYETVLDAD